MSRRSARYLIGPAAALVCGAWAVDGAADAGKLQLEWTAPADCPDRAALERRLDELLGAPTETLLTRDLFVRVRIVRAEDGFDLQLYTRTGDGEHGSRHLHGAACDKLSAAGAVIIALAVDPASVRTHSPEATAAFDSIEAPGAPEKDANPSAPKDSGSSSVFEPEPQAGAEVDKGAEVDERPLPSAPSQRGADAEDQLGVVAGVSGVLDAGTLPGVAPGISAAFGLRSGPFRAELYALFLPYRFARSEEDSNKGGTISLFAGGPGLCYEVLPGAAAISGCVAVEVGRLHGRGRGLRAEGEEGVPWLAGLGGLDLRLTSRGPLSLRFQARAVVPAGRPTFRYRRADATFEDVHRPAAIAARLSAGLDVSF